MVLDEPFNGIDLESSERLFLILQKIRDYGKTIILSSHILSSLTTICDKIHHLEKGTFTKSYDKNEFDGLTTLLKHGINQKIEQQLGELMR
jgi:ABC-2 type transport system ATP-binding protein